MPSDQADEEIARRRDEALARLLKMPPKPHEQMKLGRPRRKGEPRGEERPDARQEERRRDGL
jgi:hypothetical protein